MSCCVTFGHVILHHVMSYHVASCYAISSCVRLCHIMFCEVMSCHVLFSDKLFYGMTCWVELHYVMSCCVILCHIIALCHFASCHIMSYHGLSCCIVSCHIMSYYGLSCCIVSCHIMSYHGLPCCIVSYHICVIDSPSRGGTSNDSIFLACHGQSLLIVCFSSESFLSISSASPILMLRDSLIRAKSVVVKWHVMSSAIGIFIRINFCNRINSRRVNSLTSYLVHNWKFMST